MASPKPIDWTNQQTFRSNICTHIQGGRALLEELDKFTSLAHQILLAKRREADEREAAAMAEEERRQREEEQKMEMDEQDEAETDGATDGDEEDEEMDEASQQRRKALAAFPTKQLPTTVEDETAKERAERKLEKAKRRVLGSRLVRELREELEEAPELVRDEPLFVTDAASFSKRAEARRRYEEANFIRLGQNKEERKAERRQRMMATGNQLERELLSFGRYRMPAEDGDQPGMKRKGRGGAKSGGSNRRSRDSFGGSPADKKRKRVSFGTKPKRH